MSHKKKLTREEWKGTLKFTGDESGLPADPLGYLPHRERKLRRGEGNG